MSTIGRQVIFGLPFFDEVEEELVTRTLAGGWIGQGPLVERFEADLGEYLGAQHVVAVNSCTAGLHLALLATGIGPGDEVITTPFTFAATVNAIEHAGARPVFCDIDRSTLNLEPDAIASLVTERTRAVLPVHFGGRPLDTAAIYQLADANDLWVIEDAAHAIGAVADGKMVGGSGHPRSVAVFSFYPNKNLASAEGGALSFDDGSLTDRLRRLRLHGLDADAWQRYRTSMYTPSLAVEAGFKYNWTDLQAAIALGQLDKLEGFLATREQLAGRYDELLAMVPGVSPVDRGRGGIGWRHALHLYQVVLHGPVGRRDRIVASMRARGVGAAVHYIGLNHHPHYADRFGGVFPNSDWASEALISLPLHPSMSQEDLEYVVDVLAEAEAAETAEPAVAHAVSQR